MLVGHQAVTVVEVTLSLDGRTESLSILLLQGVQRLLSQQEDHQTPDHQTDASRGCLRGTVPSWALLYYSKNHSKQIYIAIASLVLPTFVWTPTMNSVAWVYNCWTASKCEATAEQPQWCLVQVARSSPRAQTAVLLARSDPHHNSLQATTLKPDRSPGVVSPIHHPCLQTTHSQWLPLAGQIQWE